MLKNKKGQVFEQMQGLAVGIVVLSILLTVSFLIMKEGKNVTVSNLVSTNYVNATKTLTLDQFTSIGPCVSEENFVITSIYNSSGGVAPNIATLNSGNYTISGRTINLSDDRLGVGVGSLGSTVNMTYSCKAEDAGYNSTTSLQNATASVPGWTPIIVVAVVGAALLGLVGLFRRRE